MRWRFTTVAKEVERYAPASSKTSVKTSRPFSASFGLSRRRSSARSDGRRPWRKCVREWTVGLFQSPTDVASAAPKPRNSCSMPS